MNPEAIIVGLIVGLAGVRLIRRWIAAARRRKEGGCAGGCGCADKVKRKK